MAIVARWEWRVFGKGDFGEAEKMIRALPMDSNKKTEEEYILSRKSDENVKIRFDLIDVKSLQRADNGKSPDDLGDHAEFPEIFVGHIIQDILFGFSRLEG